MKIAVIIWQEHVAPHLKWCIHIQLPNSLSWLQPPWGSMSLWTQTPIIILQIYLTHSDGNNMTLIFIFASIFQKSGKYARCVAGCYKCGQSIDVSHWWTIGALREKEGQFDWPVFVPTGQCLTVQLLQSLHGQSVSVPTVPLMLLARVSPPQRRQQQRPGETAAHHQVCCKQGPPSTLRPERERDKESEISKNTNL